MRRVAALPGAEHLGGGAAVDDAWSVPLEAAAEVLELLADAGVAPSEDAVAAVVGARVVAERRQRLLELAAGRCFLAPDSFPAEFLPHQRTGSVYLVEAERVLLADAMGLGKSAQALHAAERTGAFPVLVLCPASLERKWCAEVARWLPGRSVVSMRESRRKTDVLVLPYSLLRSTLRYLVTVRVRVGCELRCLAYREPAETTTPASARREVLARLRKRGDLPTTGEDLEVRVRPADAWFSARLAGRARMAARLRPSTVILDEAHLLKTPSSLRGRTAAVLAGSARHRYLLTASPILNRVEDLLHLLEILGVLPEVFGARPHLERFLREGRAIGAGERRRRVLEVRERLVGRCLLRRRREDVLADLPPVRHAIIPVDLTNRDEYNAAERDVVAWLRTRGDEERAAGAERARTFARLRELAMLSAHGKLAAVSSWLSTFVTGTEEDERFLLFGRHVAPLLEIGRRMRWPVVYGETPPAERSRILDAFGAGRWRGLVMQVEVGALGLDVTAASHVGFLEPTWRPADHHQAIGRAYGRLSDPHGVVAWWFVGHGTIDEAMAEALDLKSTEAAAAIDGGEATADRVFRAILQRLRSGGCGACG